MADFPLSPPFAYPKIDRDSLLQLLQGNRESNYDFGREMLKEKMIPALQGHDYVPPNTQFNDTPTIQQDARNMASNQPNYDWLKFLEQQMQNNLKFSAPDSKAEYPIGYNSNDRT